MTKPHYPCTNCQTTDPAGQWWGLGNYFGVSGTFCPGCYEMVSHDPYGNPRHPDDYHNVLKKQQAAAMSQPSSARLSGYRRS